MSPARPRWSDGRFERRRRWDQWVLYNPNSAGRGLSCHDNEPLFRQWLPPATQNSRLTLSGDGGQEEPWDGGSNGSGCWHVLELFLYIGVLCF